MYTKNVSVDQIKMYLDTIIFARSLFGFTEEYEPQFLHQMAYHCHKTSVQSLS
jgi:hypothetical protein